MRFIVIGMKVAMSLEMVANRLKRVQSSCESVLPICELRVSDESEMLAEMLYLPYMVLWGLVKIKSETKALIIYLSLILVFYSHVIAQ